jgi:hypothetical protein
MNSLPNNHHESLEPVATDAKEQPQHNRKQRRNFDRIKRKAKRAIMKAGMKVK